MYGCVMILSGMLFGMLFGMIGFKMGKKSESKRLKKRNVAEIVSPTEETQRLLDLGFQDLSEGDPKKALNEFRKAKEGQDTLQSLDYLVGYAALLAGESSLAKESLQSSVLKKEMEPECQVLLSLLEAGQVEAQGSASLRIVDPMASAESAFREYTAQRPLDAAIYGLWADVLRSKSTYRSAADFLHQGVLRAVPESSAQLLSAKELLTRMQDSPPKSVPSADNVASMDAEQALGAAYAALFLHDDAAAAVFLGRASKLYPPVIYREIFKDPAFAAITISPALDGLIGRH